MPPRKEPCRNFQRGSCQYGERCKFLHVNQQQPKPNAFGFGVQSNTQFQRANSQQQKANPFGFGVQGNSQARGTNDFGSKQNQFKPFENKWTRFSPINSGGSQASRQPDSQPSTANHKCTDSESCKRQIVEDFEHERPLWKLTCYGHCKSSPCDIIGDVSFEELRSAAYDDAKRGLSLQSIVERERSLLNAKLLEFDNLLRNPYAVPQNSATVQSALPVVSPGLSPMTGQNSTPPLVSSFSQLGASLNTGPGMRPAAPTNNAFGSFQIPTQTATAFGTNNAPFGANNSPFGSSGSFGSQVRPHSFGSSSASNLRSFGNSSMSTERNPFSTFAPLLEVPSSASVQSHIPNGPNFASTAVGQVSANAVTSDNMLKGNGTVDDSIWSKDEWTPGKIPEEAPPDKYIF